MDRQALAKQLTEELLHEFNTFHDAQGRFTNRANAMAPGVRDFESQMAHGLRPGRTAKVAGHIRINGKVLHDAVIGMQPNGNRFVRGYDAHGRLRHIALGNEYRTRIGKDRPAQDIEVAAFAHAQEAARPLPMDRFGGQARPPAPRAVTPPIPTAGPVKVAPGEPRAEGESPLQSPVVAIKKLGGGVMESHVVTFADGTKGVWKPVGKYHASGDVADKEAAAYDVAKALGMEHLVPETVTRELTDKAGNVQFGSMQRFVPGENAAKEKDPYDGDDDLKRAAAFDLLVGNSDRHDENWMVSADGRIHLIDHGYAFKPQPNLSVDRYHTRLLDAAGMKQLSTDLVRKEWDGTWPNIESAMLKRGLSQAHVDGAHARFSAIMAADNFKTLRETYVWAR